MSQENANGITPAPASVVGSPVSAPQSAPVSTPAGQVAVPGGLMGMANVQPSGSSFKTYDPAPSWTWFPDDRD